MLTRATVLLVVFSFLNSNAFAFSLNCKFKDAPIAGVQDIQLTEEALIINGKLEIALEKTKIRCGSSSKRDRYEGTAEGYQVILKDCSPEDDLEGHLINSVKQEAAEISCG